MQRPRCERLEMGEPFAPCRLLRPRRQILDDRQRELAQMNQIAEVALVARDAGGLRLFLPQLGDAVLVVRGEPFEPPAPARAAVLARPTADDRRLDDELLPLPRRSQSAGDDRFLV